MALAKVIAVAAQKGGIGKTTTAVNLASCIAMRATPILLIDLDPQGSTMDWVGMMDKNDNKLFDYMKALQSDMENLIFTHEEYYQYIIIDCPPRLEKIMAKVISISDLIVTPVGLGAIEAWAVEDFNKSVKHHQRMNKGKPKQAVFLSDVHPSCTKLITEASDNLKEAGYNPLATIHTRVSIINAPAVGKCTIHMDDEKASKEIENLTTQVMEITHDSKKIR